MDKFRLFILIRKDLKNLWIQMLRFLLVFYKSMLKLQMIKIVIKKYLLKHKYKLFGVNRLHYLQREQQKKVILINQ